MTVTERKPVPIYEVVCHECKSKIEYMASEVYYCSITCPVCGISNSALTLLPVRYEDQEESDDGEA